MKKFVLSAAIGALSFASSAAVASAHSVVSPSQTTTSKYETFSLGVPSEKPMPTVSVKLLIPSGIDKITPYVKPGWKITEMKNGDTVTAIEWTGGSIPAGQKDIFQFSARTAPTAETLVWKAYQTYSDGTIIAWDRDPKSGANGATVENPYSTTAVVTDASVAATDAMGMPVGKNSNTTFVFSIVALALSALSLALTLRK